MAYKIGMIVPGTVAGIQPYGVFVTLDDQTQGLIHISELQHGYVENIEDILHVNDQLDVMILDIDEYTKKMSLSMRTLAKPEHKKTFSRKKVPRYGTKKQIGFASLKEKLPHWVEAAKRDMNNSTE